MPKPPDRESADDMEDYRAFVERKVAIARRSIEAGRVRANEDVARDFAVIRQRLGETRP